jgi:hypothetical protein
MDVLQDVFQKGALSIDNNIYAKNHKIPRSKPEKGGGGWEGSALTPLGTPMLTTFNRDGKVFIFFQKAHNPQESRASCKLTTRPDKLVYYVIIQYVMLPFV